MSAKSPYYLNRYLPFVFLLTIPFLKSEAQNKVRFEHITTENGLSQNDVNCIFQDSEGFMWFGTHDGLNKYDGHRFTIYRPDSENPHSIKSNLIAALDEDRNGNIWIGTTGKGLARFDKKTEEFVHFQYDATTDSSLSNDYVNALHIDRFNRLWVGTSDGLNLRYLSEDPFKKNAFIRIDVDAKNQGNHLPTYVNCLHEEPNGTLWLGTMNGLYQLMNTREHEQVRVSSSFFTENSINSITQDGSGALILGSKHGLYYQTGEKPYGFSKILDGLHKKICFDNQKNIWSGTDNGLYLLNNSEKQSEPVLKTRFEENVKDPGSLNKNLIKSIYKDRMGIIWIGMNGGGLNKFDPSGKNFTHVKKTIDPKSLTYNKIRAIYEDSHKTLWIGTEGGGLDMLATGKSSTSNTFDHFTRSLNVFTMAEVEIDRRHFLLAGCEKEPFLFIKDITEPSSITQFSSLPGIRGGAFSIIQDTQGFIWIGSYFNGVYRWDPNTELSGHNFFQIGTHNTNLPSKIIRNIFEDTRGNIWLGTGDGLCKLTPEEAHSEKPDFIIYQNDPYDRTTLSHNYILPIYESRNGTLWIGTFGGGLNRLDREKGVFKSYTEKDGLANNVIKAIQEDDNQNLWISTNKGLTRFDPKRETFTNYDINDGLQSHEFQELASVKRANGEMIFGGVNGFNVFFPDEIKDNQQKAKGVLTDFYVFNQRIKPNSKLNGRVLLEQPVSKTKEIRLKHYENSFSFDFAALHFAAPNKNQYAYKLEGFDENWTYTNAEKPFANYTNISAGNYEFKLRVSNNDNLWTDTYESLALIVNPPFWLTPLAYVLYALCGIVILLVLRRYTIIRITEKHHLQLERLDREKSEELHQTKLQFFTNISHEFKTPLTLIIGPLEELLKKDQDNDRSIQYKLIQKNSQYLLRLVNQLIDFRKLDQGRMKLKIANGELTDFIAESCAPFQFLANKRNINYRITVPQASPPTWYDADVLEKIMNNLLSNAFKFTPEYGEISVEILFPQQAGSNPPRDVFNARKTASEEYVKILIKDSGSGIGKNKIQKIFDRFYNEGPTLNGSGIGLSFVQSLVKLHHGNIEVESKPGFGSLFTVAIPFKKESYTYDEIVDTTYEEGAPHFEPVRFFQPTEVSHLVVPQPSGETTPELPILLVVDDHSDIRAFIRRGLSDHYQIIEADNGESGYSRAIEYLPDIVVSDIVMPKMDGISLLNRLKSDKKTSHIPVLLLTAITSENTEFQGIEGGADGYITKPFRIDLLMLRIKNIMFYREQLRKRFAIDTAMQPTEVTVTSADEQFIQQAMEIVELHMMDADFTVNEFVKEIGLSRSNLYSKFKELTGMSTSEFVRSVRLKRAIHLLEKSDLSVKEVMYRTGFNTASYFTKCFKKQFGFTPSEYESSPSDKSTTEKAPHPPDYTTEKMGL